MFSFTWPKDSTGCPQLQPAGQGRSRRQLLPVRGVATGPPAGFARPASHPGLPFWSLAAPRLAETPTRPDAGCWTVTSDPPPLPMAPAHSWAGAVWRSFPWASSRHTQPASWPCSAISTEDSAGESVCDRHASVPTLCQPQDQPESPPRFSALTSQHSQSGPTAASANLCVCLVRLCRVYCVALCLFMVRLGWTPSRQRRVILRLLGLVRVCPVSSLLVSPIELGHCCGYRDYIQWEPELPLSFEFHIAMYR